MEYKPPSNNISEHPLLSFREQQVEECLRVCDEAKVRLDELKGRAASGDLRAASQLETEGPKLEARIEEYTARASKLISMPLT